MTEHPNVVDTGDLEWEERPHGDRFGYRRKQPGSAAGGESIGGSLYEVPSGKRVWPRHYHLVGEEAIYVLQGRGKLGIGDEEVGISKGAYVASPAGEERAHQVVNDSDEPLRYLRFSTMNEPDLIVYPDSNKVGLFAGAAPGGPKDKRIFSKLLKSDAEVGYYEGEE